MFFEDIKIGMAVDVSPVTVEKEKMIAFAMDYDNIPLHTDEEYAKKTPFISHILTFVRYSHRTPRPNRIKSPR